MGNRFTGKVAVVTGGGHGIGRNVAMLLAQEGASVIINDSGCKINATETSNPSAGQVAKEIRSGGGNAIANYEDVSLMEGGERLIKVAIDKYQRLDILVNSISVLRNNSIYKMTLDEFDVVVRNNLKGTFVPTRFAAVQFRKQRSGRIVNITSNSVPIGVWSSNYATASEAIIGLTRTVARDMGKYGVTCNNICPVSETKLSTLANTESIAIDADGQKPKTSDDPKNIAALATFLCTDSIPNVNGYTFGVSEGTVYLYSNPSIQKSVHKWGTFTIEEIDHIVPKTIGA